MAKAPQALLAARHQTAASAVRAALVAQSIYQVLSHEEETPLSRLCSVVWRRRIRVGGRDRTVDVGIPPYFPDEPPLACVIEWKDLVGSNPHVLQGGFLCVIPDSAAIDSSDPVGLVTYTFDGAIAIIEGTSQSDFQDEFSAYWSQSTGEDANAIVLIDPVSKLGNTFPVISREKSICVAASHENLSRWLSNLFSEVVEVNDRQLGISVRLDSPLLPCEYPSTLADLVALAEKHDTVAARFIKTHIANNDGPTLALLLQKECGGLALGGVVFDGLGLSRLRDRSLYRGFRFGAAPPWLLVNRSAKRMAAANVGRGNVVRVDHEHLHTRGGDGRDLSQKSVLVLGCGSLGGYVAHLLSQAGVGRMTLLDKERLAWENLGRHILGASYIGKWKAEALAQEITRQMPHLEVDHVAKDWRKHFVETPDLFGRYDLVISTIADWRSEAPLNTLVRQSEMPQILFGWLEPYAVAGHCLVIGPNGGCFQCGADSFGRFGQEVCSFKETTLSKDPGGCTYYQQYGPIAMMPVATLIATAVVDSLVAAPTESRLRTWISTEEHLSSVEAVLTNAWAPEVRASGYSRTFHKTLNFSERCPVCSWPES